MPLLLDGRKIQSGRIKHLTKITEGVSRPPTLAIIQVGARADSTLYIEQKKKFAKKIGAKVVVFRYGAAVSEEEITKKIHELNADPDIHGIIPQLPFTKHLDVFTITESITREKDTDGLTASNIKLCLENNPQGIIPATTKGIIVLLDYYSIPITGKHVVIIGRSTLVGKPTALAFINRNATVTICHRETKNLIDVISTADVLISAAGQPGLITKEHVRAGQIVVDVGITAREIEGKRILSGDVDFPNVSKVVTAITPVPGGVGPMTVLSLFENLFDAYKK